MNKRQKEKPKHQMKMKISRTLMTNKINGREPRITRKIVIFSTTTILHSPSNVLLSRDWFFFFHQMFINLTLAAVHGSLYGSSRARDFGVSGCWWWWVVLGVLRAAAKKWLGESVVRSTSSTGSGGGGGEILMAFERAERREV
jgi:uncharacterized membrane protein YgcG